LGDKFGESGPNSNINRIKPPFADGRRLAKPSRSATVCFICISAVPEADRLDGAS
jgi:hypothetical protein